MSLVRCMGGAVKPEPERLVLIKDGKRNTDILTGGSAVAYDYSGNSSSNNRPIVMDESNDFKLYVPVNGAAYQNGSFIFLPPIDFSKYSKLHMYCKLSCYAGSYEQWAVRICPAASQKTTKDIVSINNATDYRTVDIDVSSIEDEQFICFWASSNVSNANNNVIIYDLWLEPKEETYLYKDGKYNVVLDNGGYKLYFNWNISEGFELLENRMEVSSPTTQGNGKIVVTHNPIDVSEYRAIKVVSNNTVVSQIDISSLQSSVYIAIIMMYYTDGRRYFRLVVGSGKDEIEGKNLILEIDLVASSTSDLNNQIINRIWLEK